jgi:uroporphyrinogen-III decarboxylase
MKGEMTGKERILNALRRQPVDRVPWVPLLVPYTIAGFPKGAPHRVVEAQREVGCDIWTQAIVDRVGLWMPKGKSKIEKIQYFEDGDIILGYKTPVGTITERQRSGVGGSLNVPVEHLLKTPEDLRVYRYVLENTFLFVADLTDHYDWENKLVGEDGVITDVSIGLSPFQMLINILAGVENTYALQSDEPELFDEVMELMHRNNLIQIQETIKRSKADIFVNSENTSWTTISPKFYQQYCRKQLDEYSNILHEYGKLHVVHMCGKLEFLKDEIANSSFDGVADIAPAPTGDMELWEAAKNFPNLAVKGGIGCDTFITGDPSICYNKAVEILERTKGRPGILLGSGDSVPNGTSIENLRSVTKAVEEMGRC